MTIPGILTDYKDKINNLTPANRDWQLMVCIPPFPTLSPPPPKALMSESGSLPCLAARCQARQCEFTETGEKQSLSYRSKTE
jgi:hypothetical protein